MYITFQAIIHTQNVLREGSQKEKWKKDGKGKDD